jgi:ParB-like chromosome segregation protein Spo0J
MKEISYAKLIETQKASIHECTIPDRDKCLYVVNDQGAIVGYRLPKMFSKGVPVKWQDERLDLATGNPLIPGWAPEEKTDAPAVVDQPKEPARQLPFEVLPPVNGAVEVLRTKLLPSPLNPRKSFEEEYLTKLAATLKAQGILNDLIVRRLEFRIVPPEITNSWYVEWKRAGEWVSVWHHFEKPKFEEAKWSYLVTQEDAEAALDWLPLFEIICGECRWRASGIAEIEKLPVKIRDLSDADALELMLVENMRRKDLSTIEECDAFNRALEQKNADGTPVYLTLEAFAAKIGEKKVGYIKDRLALKKLPGAGRLALENEDISFKTARVICRVRETHVEKVLDVALHPWKFNVWTDGEKRPLNADELESYVREHVARELRDTCFQQNDARLLPVEIGEAGVRVRGGACTDCPWNSANEHADDQEPQPGRGRGRPRGEGKWCQNPDCFAKKVEIHTAAALVKAKEDGCTILSAEEAEKILYDDGTIRHGKPFVRLDAKPDFNEKNDKIEDKKLPTWGKIITGTATAKVVTGRNEEGEAERSEMSGEVGVPISVAVTSRGHVIKIVERSVAVVAAQKLGTAHFLSLSGGGRSLSENDEAERQRKEREAVKLRNEVSFAAMRELVAVVANTEETPTDLYMWLVEVGLWHGGNDVQGFVSKRREFPNGDLKKTIGAAMKGAPWGEHLALALEIMVARQVKFNGVGDPHFQRIAQIYGVNVWKIEKAIRAAHAEKKKKAKKKSDKGKKSAPATKKKGGAK